MNQPQVPQEVAGKVQPLYEKHRTIYVRSVSGTFNRLRWAMVFLTQALFYGLCWIDWNGRQAVLFHLVERKFYIFGLVLWPQDVIYLTVLLLISAYGLFLFTAMAGRLFCGYACPQTVYTEIFLWIERLVEGERPARMKLDGQPLGLRKARLKLAKHALWLALALWTGFTFVAYFTPVKELSGALLHWTLGPWETFWIFFYAGFTYLMAGYLREQVCKHMCPYARFQSVMFDPDTMIVTYDPQRGEPRGPRKKGGDPAALGLGECVDCAVCVQVCPTGIDIRNGLQYECIGCAACIDGCDEIMDKMGYPRGLVRYSTENAMERRLPREEMFRHVLRPRVLVYMTVLLLIIAAAGWSLFHRIPLRVDVIRDRAVMAREVDDGAIENVYTLQFMNMDDEPHRYDIRVSGLEAIGIAGETHVSVPAETTHKMLVLVRARPGAEAKKANPVFFDIEAAEDASIRLREKASFLLP